MHGAAEMLGEFFEVSVKPHNAIVAALNDLPGNAGNGHARSAGHGEDSVATEGQGPSELTVVCPRLLFDRSIFVGLVGAPPF